MFEATAAIGGLDLQLVFYRGYDECKASRWLTTATDLHRVMRSVSCVGGETQIERVLSHAIRETGRAKVNAEYLGFSVTEPGDSSFAEKVMRRELLAACGGLVTARTHTARCRHPQNGCGRSIPVLSIFE